MNILGVGGLSHDPSVALIVDNEIVMAIESEKVTRYKHEISACPVEAIRFILEYNNIDLKNIDYITTNWKAGFLANKLYLKHLFRFAQRHCYPLSIFPTFLSIANSHNKAAFSKLQKDYIPPIVQVKHHLAHLGSCYTLSPYEEAAVAIIDGSGELECTSLYHCTGRKIKKLYIMATIHLGYNKLGDEYKVMGLAPYGRRHQKFEEFFKNLIRLLPNGRYQVDRKLAGNYLVNEYVFPKHTQTIIGLHKPESVSQFTQEHMDFAYALQSRIEEAIIHVVRHLRKLTTAKYLALAGGVALNSVSNGKIRENIDFEDIFIQPAAHDAGTALGAAAFVQYHQLGLERPHPFTHAYLGPSYDDAQIESELQKVKAPYKRVKNPAKEAANLIVSGKVIGWFQGAAEFGPRALGNRSILADPRDPQMKDKVNKLIKERENYRPFAPAILEDKMSDYFDNLVNTPYMLLVNKVKHDKHQEIPAVVHVDGTARPQSVDYDANPLFYKLIEEFYNVTGVPVVLNTSFNVAGEPIVMKPVDAIRCFYGCGLDALVIGSFIIEKA